MRAKRVQSEDDTTVAMLPAPNETLVQMISRTYHALLPHFERHVGMSRALDDPDAAAA